MEVKIAVALGRSSRTYRSAAEGVFGPDPMEVKNAVARDHVSPDEGCCGTKQCVSILSNVFFFISHTLQYVSVTNQTVRHSGLTLLEGIK